MSNRIVIPAGTKIEGATIVGDLDVQGGELIGCTVYGTVHASGASTIKGNHIVPSGGLNP